MPLMIEEMSMTVMTPTTTPMIVRKERILLPLKVLMAIFRFS